MIKRIIFFSIFISIIFIFFLHIKSNKQLDDIQIIMRNQEIIYNAIEKEIISSKNEISNIKIINNPYGYTPLSYLVAFYTKKSEKIKVYINDTYYYTTKKSKKHIIPIYGLISGQKNEVKLCDEDCYKYEISSFDNFNSNINHSSKLLNNYFMFTDGLSNITYIYDFSGNLIWYFNGVTSNNAFYYNHEIVLPIEINENYYFLHIDLMGKIIRYTKISNMPNILELQNDNIYFSNIIQPNNTELIYKYNLKTSKIELVLNVSNIIDKNLYLKSEINKTKNGKSLNHINSFYILKDNMYISLRNISSILEVNLKSKEITNILTSNKYILKNINSSHYIPISHQHDFNITNSNFSLFNNNIFNISNTCLGSYPIIYDYDENLSSLNVKWYYCYEKPLYCKYNSSFIYGNDYKIINYSHIVNSSIFDNEDTDLYDYDFFTKIVILNKKNDIILDMDLDQITTLNIQHIYDLQK